MHSGDEKVVVKTEVSHDYVLLDEPVEVKIEYDEFAASDNQWSVPAESNIKCEPESPADVFQEALQWKQTASSSTASEPVAKEQDLLKCDISFGCTICLEDFPHEEDYYAHMNMHLQNRKADSECVTSRVCEPSAAVSSGWHSPHLIENKTQQSSQGSQNINFKTGHHQDQLNTRHTINVRTAYNVIMEKQPDEPGDVTNEPLSMREPMEVPVAVSSLPTPFAQPKIAASNRKSKAQRQREYRQRIAASRTPAQAAAAREARNLRDRNNRLRQANARTTKYFFRPN